MKKIKILCFLLAGSLVLASALGAAWTTKRFTNTAGYSSSPDIAIDGADIYVAWCDETPGNPEIYFRKVGEGAKRLTYNDGSSLEPAIAVSGSTIGVVWKDFSSVYEQVYFRGSTDGGKTWQACKKLSGPNSSFDQDIAASGSTLYVVWACGISTYDDEIYFRRSLDGGVTWEDAKPITKNAENSREPAIAVSGADMYVVWSDLTPGHEEIYFLKSTDGGTTWQDAKRLTNSPPSKVSPDVAISGANVYVVWNDTSTGLREIYFRKSVDGGASWGNIKQLTNNAGLSQLPVVAAAGTKIYVAWCDYSPGNPEIYFRKAANSGTTWQTAQRLTSTPMGSYDPAIAVSASKVYVAWQDDTTGNDEIYLASTAL